MSLLSGRIDLDEDHVLRQNMMESLRSTGAIKNDFSNIESEKIGSDSEAALARDLLNLFATIPSKIYQSDDCQLHAYVDKNGVSIFKFTVKNAPEDAVLAQSIIDEFHDELLSLTRSGLIPTLSHNDKSDSFTVKEPSDIFEMFVKIYPYLESLNKNMARVLYSTAISIYDGHDALENDYDLTTLSNGQIAIIKALRSIISTYDNTLDFTVTATDDLAENNDAREYSFDISLGRNSPISFDKRFRTLLDVFDDFNAAEDCLNHKSEVALWGCQTGFSIRTNRLDSLFHIIVFMYEESEVSEKSLRNQSRLEINLGELNAILNEQNRGLKYQAFQH